MINAGGDNNEKSRFTESHITIVLKEVDAGMKIE